MSIEEIGLIRKNVLYVGITVLMLFFVGCKEKENCCAKADAEAANGTAHFAVRSNVVNIPSRTLMLEKIFPYHMQHIKNYTQWRFI
jgi:hypothetical protein